MKSFPFDSQVSYDSFGNPSYDRAVNSAELADNIALLYTNGVLNNPSTCLQVTESESQMSVQVLPGACNINGRLGREDNARTIVFEAADSSYDRIDRVVLRLNTNVDIRAIDIYVLKGTPAATPTAPALTRTGGIYELCLADIFVAKNTAYVSAARITDTRMNDELCGYMMTNPQSIDSSTIFNQYQAALDEFLEFANDTIGGTVIGSLEENFAPLYSTTTPYKVGDMVTHKAKYYVCQAETSGTWDESKWIRTNVSGQIAQINNDLSDIQQVLEDNALWCIFKTKNMVTITINGQNGSCANFNGYILPSKYRPKIDTYAPCIFFMTNGSYYYYGIIAIRTSGQIQFYYCADNHTIGDISTQLDWKPMCSLSYLVS